jgi:dipeptidyl aminopeptidase/acylaminoacyl peptidase
MPDPDSMNELAALAHRTTLSVSRLTEYLEDDGQEISDLAFTSGGKSIVYVRGSGASRRGEIPNPLSRPEGSAQAVFVVAVSGGAPRRLAEGHSPALSPKGDRVAYVLKDQVWSVALEGSEKPAQLFKARGEEGGLRWSPDGSRLAFVSRRGDHSFIGLCDPSGKTLSYIDPSVDRDSNPRGRRTASVSPSCAFPPLARPSFSGRTASEAWSIRVADAATGQSREVFRADKGAAARGVVARPTLWSGGVDQFPWKDSWTHLYSVPAAGGPPALLTRASSRVEYVSLAADRRKVFFNGRN